MVQHEAPAVVLPEEDGVCSVLLFAVFCFDIFLNDLPVKCNFGMTLNNVGLQLMIIFIVC